jgi:hypothetical protein
MVRLIMRNYFSSHLLAAAGQMARAAGESEDLHDVTGPSRFDLEQRSHVLGAILCGVGFVEAMVNELFQDALDEHAPPGSGIASLSVSTQAMMAEYWRATDKGQKGRALAKYQALLRFAGQPLLDEGAQPYQDANLAVQLRNAIAHYRPEDLSADEPAMMARLKGKFPDNRLLTGSANPWWPDHCLGVGCARWVLDSVVTVADHVVEAVGANPNYSVHRASGWLGPVPGAPES